MTNKDIIFIGLQPWDIEIGSNCKNIALEMAKDNRVLYVNNPIDMKWLLLGSQDDKRAKRMEVIRGRRSPIEQINDNMWTLYPRTVQLSANWIKLKPVFDHVNRINNRNFSSEIRKAAARLGFSKYYLFNDNSIFLGQHQQEYLRPQQYIYYIRDNLSKNNYWQYHGSRLEPLLIASADKVVTNSLYYRDYARAYNSHSYMVGQGCDLTYFNPNKFYNVPEDIQNAKRPIIGYVGFLSHRRLDISLLAELAERRPEWQLVLVGPEDGEFKASSLHRMNNVIFLGPKPEALIPTYISAFDVCLNPQLINDSTIGNYPRKIDEYLAMGKPVVASSTQAMDYFREYVYLGKTAKDYETHIATALQESTHDLPSARVQFARQHTWKNSVEHIYQAISRVKDETKRNNQVKRKG